MKIMISGGAGYVGSVIASACSDAGIVPILVDDLRSGRVKSARNRILFEGDVADSSLISKVFKLHPDIDAVIHCAAMASVQTAMRTPAECYQANVCSALSLAQSLVRLGCYRLLFSSTAAVYSSTPDGYVDEASVLAPANPYGNSKLMAERVLRDLAAASPLRCVALRYFNVVGADAQLRTGPTLSSPTHVLSQMIHASRSGVPFQLYGTDWPSRDGTAVRDFVHVQDVAASHLAILKRFDELPEVSRDGFDVFNVGSGVGTTIGELIRTFESTANVRLKVEVAPRRAGDVFGAVARIQKIDTAVGWRPRGQVPGSGVVLRGPLLG